VVREISKKFEETVTGTLAELAERYEDAPPKGEIVIVIGPPGEAAAPAAETLDAALRQALASASVKDAAAEIAARFGLRRREVYARALELKRQGMP
jgi:16S rRNA (cytidine1402-2'-O)-methyltransferase